jgi:hypothetical protein
MAGLLDQQPHSAIAALRDAGIHGHQFLDGQSRKNDWVVTPFGDHYQAVSPTSGKGPLFSTRAEADEFIENIPGTHNYVIYDDAMVNITSRNGTPVGPER